MFWLAVHDCLQQLLYCFLQWCHTFKRGKSAQSLVRENEGEKYVPTSLLFSFSFSYSYEQTPLQPISVDYFYLFFCSCFQEYIFRVNLSFNTWQLLKK